MALLFLSHFPLSFDTKRADEHRNIVEEQLGEYEESLLQDQQKELEAQIMKESIQVRGETSVQVQDR